MKQGKGICKHGTCVAAALGVQDTPNEFLFCICTMIWARPPAQAGVPTSQTHEVVKLRGLKSYSQGAKCCVIWGSFRCILFFACGCPYPPQKGCHAACWKARQDLKDAQLGLLIGQCGPLCMLWRINMNTCSCFREYADLSGLSP